MDQDAVYQLFVSTYHPDPNVHKQAELNIRNVRALFSVYTRSNRCSSSPPFYSLSLRQASYHWFCIFKLLKSWNWVHAKQVVIHRLIKTCSSLFML